MEKLKLWSALVVLLLYNLAIANSHEDAHTITVDLGADVVLNCAESDVVWTLTDNSTLDEASTNSNPSVQANGTHLSIQDVMYAHVGTYLCTYNWNHTKTFIVELRRPSTWETYRMNTIVGVSAAAAAIVIAVMVGLVAKYRWRDEEGDETAGLDGSWNSPNKHRNESFSNDYAKNKVGPSAETTDTYI